MPQMTEIKQVMPGRSLLRGREAYGNGKMKKVELLAPAGNFAALRGAINAGADAVYLGGNQYGARAYADNFSREEVCRGISLAHMFGRKIYLTVNTLVKESELDGLYDYLLPYYEAGLDGVIVQDLGVLRFIREHFNGLALHASTQMTLTGEEGTRLLQGEGVERIVPARELSLQEIREIKQRTGVEIEAFIHGAMCYCYSGQCLFSSLLGGRSGNRGRCAQPCRLPYRIENGKEQYPLSMRDMCTLSLLPRLIEAGIDSFKIEGRMKKPAYTAGVTSIYRKYIDLYYEDKENWRIEKEDERLLHSLYIRSRTQEGYYDRHNGTEMLTLSSPAYSETEEALLRELEKKYVEPEPFMTARAEIFLEKDKEAVLSIQAEGVSVSCRGESVQAALKQPLSEEVIIRQLQKSGNSHLKLESITVHRRGEVFLPIGALNELRRRTLEEAEKALAEKKMPLYGKERHSSLEKGQNSPMQRTAEKGMQERRAVKDTAFCLEVSVRTYEQLKAVLKSGASRIYLDYSLLMEDKEGGTFDLLRELSFQEGLQLYGATPYIVRKKDIHCLERIRQAMEEGLLFGVLVRNLESYGYFSRVLSQEELQTRVMLDGNLYLWNRESLRFWEGRAEGFYLPAECNFAEIKALLSGFSQSRGTGNLELSYGMQVYGRQPMMITANCIQKTAGGCQKKSGILTLKDRYGKLFPVLHDCLCCYNVIYNSVPLALHKQLEEIKKQGFCRMRLDLTTENAASVKKITDYFAHAGRDEKKPPFEEYTTGHYKRGVE